MSLMLIGFGALGFLFAWLVGGVLLRVGGLLLVVGGVLAVAVAGDVYGLPVAALGALLWLAGHWHYALRHQELKSPFARQVFCRWAPAWLDPTRGWAAPVEERRRRDGVDERGGCG